MLFFYVARDRGADMSYEFLLTIAIIMLSTKVFGLTSERVHMPQVVGALVAGVLVGPSCLGWVGETDFLIKTAEIGVIILMFNAGLDTDLEELKSTGFASFIIAVIGVIVPLIGGIGCYLLFANNPSDPFNMLKAAFIGVVLTATSVSITVETLREMGKLKSKVGTAILGAAVIDDILGIVVLTVLTGFTDPTVQPLLVFGRIVAFFIFVLVVGLIMNKAFIKMDQLWHKHRRIAIYALAFAFLMSYIAERFFSALQTSQARVLCGYRCVAQSDTRRRCQQDKRAGIYAVLAAVLCLDRHKNRSGGPDGDAGAVCRRADGCRDPEQDHRLRPWRTPDGFPDL